MMMTRYLFIIAAVAVIASCKDNKPGENPQDDLIVAAPASIQYNIVATYPHDTANYIQGLEIHNNELYESTGMEGFSRLMKVDLKTGKALKSQPIDKALFGEGITILNNKIYQLTWQNHKVFVYDATTFKKLQEFTWEFEGWGITHNGKELIVSTGSNILYFVNPETFKVTRQVGVNDNNGPVAYLNELEFINGFVYSNVYQNDYIVKIDPSSGQVVGKLDFTGLLDSSGIPYDSQHIDVLNGIAYDSAKNTLLITGKRWPAMFEVKLN